MEVREGNGPTTIVTGRGVRVLKGEGEGLEASGARAVEDSTTGLKAITIMSEAEAISKESVSLAEVDAQSEGAVLTRCDLISGSKF